VLDVVDVVVYVVVLNLAIEYFPSVISESFTISLLTAVLLKAVLELWRRRRVESSTSSAGRALVPGSWRVSGCCGSSQSAASSWCWSW